MGEGKKRVLIIYYSFSSQTRNLVQSFAKGLEEHEVEVHWQQLKPMEKSKFPIGSFLATVRMMLTSFLRRRMPIEPLEAFCYDTWDLIVLAGPTWSYNPCGPVLTLLDSEHVLFRNQKVLPLISCRSYWRLHFWGLSRLLNKNKAKCISPLVFTHPAPEPWSTIGVFLKMMGKVPESGKSWLSRFYPKYGHSKRQVEEAGYIGQYFGKHLKLNENISDISFPRPL